MYKLLLFGTGSACTDLLTIIDSTKANILAYVDNNNVVQGTLLNGVKVISPKNIIKYNFDYIIITCRQCDEIFKQLIDLGINENKLIVLNLYYSNKFCETLNKHTAILNKFCTHPIEPYAICNIQNLGRDRLVNVFETGDYVRLSSIELVAKEIYDNNINGCIAELGVFRGDTAKILNEVFYDRKLFLFDTFEGFSEQDVIIDRDSKFSISNVAEFSNTSVNLVLSKMKYPQNCIIKKGYFSDTAKNINEQFSFISIDTDLYSPIYAGLEFFYPRLVKGGYIFIHDYNNFRFKGAKEAVKKYCRKNSINYFPLSDISGTAVITK